MLVLMRRQQESIRISDEVVVTVVAIRGRTVRLGIEAPPHIRVVRTELISAPTTLPGGAPPK